MTLHRLVTGGEVILDHVTGCVLNRFEAIAIRCRPEWTGRDMDDNEPAGQVAESLP